MFTRRIWFLLVCLYGVQSSALLAADCSGLKDLKLEQTSFTIATLETSGTLDPPSARIPLQGRLAFCRVAGILRPTSDSKIRLQSCMPAQECNGQLLCVGIGS